MRRLLYLIGGTMLSFSTNAQLQNLDFELWQNPVTESSFSNIPVGWIWTNSAMINPDNNFYYPPSQDANSNNFALYLSVWYNYTKDAAIQYAPIANRPSALKGFYKYEHNFILGNAGMQRDTAMVSVYLTKHNGSTHTNDTIGRGILEIGESTSTYEEFTVNISYITTGIPDSITVILDPSLARRYTDRSYEIQGDSLGGHTSFFTVDNLSLISESVTGINDSKTKEEIAVYPNPARDYIHIGSTKGEITIRDISGKTVQKLSNSTDGKIKVDHLCPGIFLIQLRDGRHIYQSKFVKL